MTSIQKKCIFFKSEKFVRMNISHLLTPCISTGQRYSCEKNLPYLCIQFLDSRYAIPEAASNENFTNCLLFSSSFFFLRNDRKSPPRKSDRLTVRQTDRILTFISHKRTKTKQNAGY